MRTTAEIAATLRHEDGDRRLNHSVPVAGGVVLPDAELPLAPYALGVWLGEERRGADAYADTTAGPGLRTFHLDRRGPGVVVSLDAEGTPGTVQDGLRLAGPACGNRVPARAHSRP